MLNISEENDGEFIDEGFLAPPDFNFINDLNLDPSVKSKLSSLLSSIVKGSSIVLTTPLGAKDNPARLLKLVDQLFENNSTVNTNLMNLEILNRSKFGPRSLAKPWSDRVSGVDDYFKSQPTIPPLSPETKCYNLRPISLENSISKLKNNTNSGLPYFTRKGSVKDVYSRKFNELRDLDLPCVMFTRTQESGKTRTVWGYPMADSIDEMMYFFPLLEHQKKQIWRSALLGPVQVDRNITRLIDRATLTADTLVSIDFTAYDASVKTKLQHSCFEYIKALYQSSSHQNIDRIRDRFNTIGLITPDGVKSGSHGVPSGSTFTNEVDSIAQYLISRDIINDECIQIQGDDGVYCVREEVISPLFELFDKFGLSVNREKSYISKEFCVYLQNLYDVHYRRDDGLICGIYPIYRALNRLLYQERWSKFEDFGILGKDYYSIRAICILENCKNHPLFKEFVQLVKDFDKYNLGFTQDGLTKYINYIQSTEGVEGLIINQYGDNVRGIQSFETYKLLMS